MFPSPSLLAGPSLLFSVFEQGAKLAGATVSKLVLVSNRFYSQFLLSVEVRLAVNSKDRGGVSESLYYNQDRKNEQRVSGIWETKASTSRRSFSVGVSNDPTRNPARSDTPTPVPSRRSLRRSFRQNGVHRFLYTSKIESAARQCYPLRARGCSLFGPLHILLDFLLVIFER